MAQDTCTGFVLAGCGERTSTESNYLVVDGETPLQTIEATFQEYTNREDIGIVLINQFIANEIRHLMNDYDKTIPTLLEIPSKDQPYSPDSDYIMQRINMMMGSQ